MHMNKKVLKGLKSIVSFMLVCVLVLIGTQTETKKIRAASSTNKLPISCYILNGRLTTYTTSACSKKSGYIDSTDLCKIIAFYTKYGSVKVQYPTSSGTKTAYAKASGFFYNTNFSTTIGRTGTNLTAYRRSTGTSTIGTVYAADDCIITGTANGRTQLIYPTSGGYKLGWVSGTYNFDTSSGLTSSQGINICFNATYYANSYSDLKAAFGYDYAKLLSHWQTYGLKEGRSASPIFDPVYYLNNNSDLSRAFGSQNYTAAYNHFLQYGCKEGRISSKYYNGAYYKSKYGDLSGMSYYNLAGHYLNYGISEKRWANSSGYIPGNMTQTSSGGSDNSSSSFQWPVTNYYVCGNKWSQYYSVKGKDHLGMDIKSSSGDTSIYATGDGVVANTGWNKANGYTITLKHTISGKTIYSFYAHLSSINVSKGASVSKGQKIGVIGNTGSSSTGTHLHFAFTTQCSAGTWGYGTTFNNSANIATYSGYTFYNPSYVIANGKLP